MPGKLYLVATPIGNLGDITLRALETLKSVDLIAAEDTRRTRGLLTHFGVQHIPLVCCDAYASDHSILNLTRRLELGESIALVTDAGTPSVSDPGTALVRAAVRAGIEVVPIPGVSAVTAAVAASGLVDGPFLFLGFLPTKGASRRQSLERIRTSAEPVVLFEAPHRISRTLSELSSIVPERQAVLCRELTKLHEELKRGTVSELASDTEFRGEITLVIDGAAQLSEPALDLNTLEGEIRERLSRGESVRTVVDALSASAGVPRRELYHRVTRLSQGDQSAGGAEPVE